MNVCYTGLQQDQSGYPSSALESGLIQTACIAVRHIDAAAVLQSTFAGHRKTGVKS